jgi:cytosolic carboxypeptidase protein 2/3
MLSFEYEFVTEDDQVRFAYCRPYTYSQMIGVVGKLDNVEVKQSMKSLSGLDIPVLRVTNEEKNEELKKVVMVTARVHPGESNSSFAMESMLECLCGNSLLGNQLRNKYIFYVIPMLNPDGVVAGNYRTSLFGKDLNRTYDQQRKYAFPETY